MVSREFAGDVRFGRCSPENGFRDDAQERRNCNVPVGRLIITAPDSRKTPASDRGERARIGESGEFSRAIRRCRSICCWRSIRHGQTVLGVSCYANDCFHVGVPRRGAWELGFRNC